MALRARRRTLGLTQQDVAELAEAGVRRKLERVISDRRERLRQG